MSKLAWLAVNKLWMNEYRNGRMNECKNGWIDQWVTNEMRSLGVIVLWNSDNQIVVHSKLTGSGSLVLLSFSYGKSCWYSRKWPRGNDRLPFDFAWLSYCPTDAQIACFTDFRKHAISARKLRACVWFFLCLPCLSSISQARKTRVIALWPQRLLSRLKKLQKVRGFSNIANKAGTDWGDRREKLWRNVECVKLNRWIKQQTLTHAKVIRLIDRVSAF